MVSLCILVVIFLGVFCGRTDAIQSRSKDWMLFPHKMGGRTKLLANEDGSITLTNGIIGRQFVLTPNFATIDIRHQIENYSYYRGLVPETAVVITDASNPENSQQANVGGALGQTNYGFFSYDFFNMTTDPTAYQFEKYEVVPMEVRWTWKPNRHSGNYPWPPKGIQLEVYFTPPKNAIPIMANTVVKVIYQMFDNIPCYAKYIQVLNLGTGTVVVNDIFVEAVRVREYSKTPMLIETDYMPRHNFFDEEALNEGNPDSVYIDTNVWMFDPVYEAGGDANFRGDTSQTQLYLNVTYPVGPGYYIAPAQMFETFHTFMGLYDTDDIQRQSLQRLQIPPFLSPQITESTPYFFAEDCTDSDAIVNAINQSAQAGFEMFICAPWSGFDPSNTNTTYIAQWASYAKYAHSLGLEIGGYICMQGLYNASSEVQLPGTGGGGIACFATGFMLTAMENIRNFIRQTGIDALETDCPYEGSWCDATNHDHHGLNDSQVMQWEVDTQFYQSLRDEFNLFLNVPDP